MDKQDLRQLVAGYLQHCRFEKGLDAKTLKAYRIDLEQFHAHIITCGGAYRKDCLQAYIASLHQKYAIKTTKRKSIFELPGV